MGRIADAWNTLLGRHSVQRKYQTRIAQIEAEWLDLLVSISDTLEKLNAWHQRIVQRDKRARRAEKAIEESDNGTEPVEAQPVGPTDRKAAIRHRVAAARGGKK